MFKLANVILYIIFFFPYGLAIASENTVSKDKVNALESSDSTSKEDKEKLLSESKYTDNKVESNQIVNLIKKFVDHIQKRDYEIVKSLTIGREKDLYSDLNGIFSSKNDVINQTIKKYFSGLNGFVCDFIYVDLKLKKSIAMCDFEFKNDFSGISHSKKIRKINYYLVKTDDGWKIAYSKLKNEIIYTDLKNYNLKK